MERLIDSSYINLGKKGVKKKYLTPFWFFSNISFVMDNLVEKNMLYDFYGDLLTEHQRSIYEDAVFGDFSLSELSESYGITRQGIHDLIKRCNKALEEYENTLHLVEKFINIRKEAEFIKGICSDSDNDKFSIISQHADRIIEEL